MKTYKKTIDRPLLEIKFDEYSDSPRGWGNLGYFITQDSRYSSPDKHEILQEIIRNTGDVASNCAEHMQLIKDDFDNMTEKIVVIYPITKYEHGGISYSLGQRFGFDNSNNGFYIITDKTQRAIGTKKNDFERVIKNELSAYNKWVNGDVYGFILHNEAGEVVDSCWGFYDIEDIRSYLPDSFKKENLQEYVVN